MALSQTSTGSHAALSELLESEGDILSRAVRPNASTAKGTTRTTGTGATAPTPDYTGFGQRTELGELHSQDVLDIHRKRAADIRAEREELSDVGFWGGVYNAAQLTTTATLLRGAQPYLEGTIEPPEDGYIASTGEMMQLASEMQLPFDAHTRNRLMQATSSLQMRRFAQDMRTAQEHRRLVGDRWVTNLVVQGLDPTEAAAIAMGTVVTGGAGAMAGISAKVARMTYAGASTASVLGLQYAASEMGGEELTTEGALLTSALMIPLTYGLSGSAIGRYYHKGDTEAALKALESYKPGAPTRKSEPEAPTGASRETPAKDTTAAQKAADDAGSPALRARGESIGKAKTAVTTAKGLVQKLHGKNFWREYLPEHARVTLEDIPMIRQDTIAEIQHLRDAIKEAGGASNAPDLAGRLKDARVDLRRLEQPESVVAAEYLGITPADYNKMVREAKEAHAAELKAAQEDLAKRVEDLENLRKAEPPKSEADSLVEEMDMAHAEVAPKIERDIHDTLRKQEQEMRDAGVSEEGIKRMSEASVALGRAQLMTGKVLPQNLHKGMRYFTELMSEHAKVTGGIPEVEKFVSKVLDDPLMRPGLIGETASSNFAVFVRRANKLQADWDKSMADAIHERVQMKPWQTFFGYSQKYIDARNRIDRMVADDLARRERSVLVGEKPTVSEDPLIAKLTNQYEDMTHAIADQARIAGLGGFEDYMRSAGYFHRSWNWENMNRLINTGGAASMREGLALGIRRVNQFLTEEDAGLMADAIINRTRNKAHSSRNDAMGQIGALEIDSMRELLMDAGNSEAVVKSIMGRLEQRSADQGSVKYAKRRIPIDMTVKFRGESGEVSSLLDLIDTDLTRLFTNYSQGMSGRSALAKVGIGGDTHGIATHLDHYSRLLDEQKHLSAKQKDAMRSKYEDILGDFTGIRKEGQVLGEGLQILKALATATMLGSTGLLQIPEMAIGAARQGAISVTKAMFKEVPGIKQFMKSAATDEALLKEWHEVMGVDFRTDLRIEGWKRQTEMGFPTDGKAIRIATAMQQLTPSVTGQRFVHGLQSDAFLKLHMRTLYRAAAGDAKSLKTITDVGDILTPDMFKMIKENANLRADGSLESLNLGRLPHHVQDAIVQQMTRLQDSVLLHHRPGWGSSYRHSAVGQLLGQFTSYVSLAHNLITRRTWHHEGALGVAKVLAYQYPMMLITTYMNELRKGNVLDLDDEDDLKKLAATALSYSAGIGMLGDAAGIALPGTPDRGMAVTGPVDSVKLATSALGDLATGEFGNAASNAVGFLRGTTILGAMAGSQLLQEALKSDD